MLKKIVTWIFVIGVQETDCLQMFGSGTAHGHELADSFMKTIVGSLPKFEKKKKKKIFLRFIIASTR